MIQIPLSSNNTAMFSTASPDKNFWDCPEIDSRLHVRASLGSPLTLPSYIDADNWVSEESENLCRWFSQLASGPYELVTRDNTYNSESQLDSEFIYTIFAPTDCSDWIWCNDIFVAIEFHRGGDVRGNYSSFQIFRVDNIGETGFFDWVTGWYCSKLDGDVDRELENINERLEIGYSSYPTGQLRDLLRAEPVWSDKRNSFVCKLADYPKPVLCAPTSPYYANC